MVSVPQVSDCISVLKTRYGEDFNYGSLSSVQQTFLLEKSVSGYTDSVGNRTVSIAGINGSEELQLHDYYSFRLDRDKGRYNTNDGPFSGYAQARLEEYDHLIKSREKIRGGNEERHELTLNDNSLVNILFLTGFHYD